MVRPDGERVYVGRGWKSVVQILWGWVPTVCHRRQKGTIKDDGIRSPVFGPQQVIGPVYTTQKFQPWFSKVIMSGPKIRESLHNKVRVLVDTSSNVYTIIRIKCLLLYLRFFVTEWLQCVINSPSRSSLETRGRTNLSRTTLETGQSITRTPDSCPWNSGRDADTKRPERSEYVYFQLWHLT